MKAPFLFLFYFLQSAFSQKFCYHEYGIPGSWGYERNAAGIFPNDEVKLSDDGQHFVNHNYYDHSSPGVTEMNPFCPKYTCGRKTFPHGFTIRKKKAVMLCEDHKCIDPENIKCRKTVENGACARENEWVAGVVERKNVTHEWLEFECCHSTTDDIEPKFVKNIAETDYYHHEIVVENETLIAMDYVKDIRKTKNIHGQIVYAASIFRMKCTPFNTTNVPSIYDSDESLTDDDGTGKFEGLPKKCNKNSDAHLVGADLQFGIHPPSRICMPKECVKNFECKKNVKLEDCAESNQWVANFTKVENETLVEVECCQHLDEINTTFVQYINFTNTIVESTDIAYPHPTSERTYINNITVDESSENGTIYFASVYEMQCELSEEAKAEIAAEEKERLFPPGFGAYFADLAKRIQKSVMKNISRSPDGKISINNADDLFGAAHFMNVSKTEESFEPPLNDPLYNDTVSLLSL